MSKGTKRKRTSNLFKKEWLEECVEIATPKSFDDIRVQLKEIFTFDAEAGVICKYCRDAKVVGEFGSGKKWGDVWKLDFLKRHLSSKSHYDSVQKLRNQNPSLPAKGVMSLLLKTPEEREKKQMLLERKRSNPDEIKVLIDNVLLAVKMNCSMHSVQHINEHMAKYVEIPKTWRSKNYAFEFLEAINNIVIINVMTEIAAATFHTLAIDESTDICVNKHLIFYFKYRVNNFTEYKTSFGGIVQLQTCDAAAIVSEIEKYYKDHKLDLDKMVMFTSDGASVMLGRHNGVAAQLKRKIPHLVVQHCVAHRDDLGICDAWKKVTLIRDLETLVRTIYTVFSRSTTKKSKFKDIVNASENKSVAFRPLNEVRWLSRHFALHAIIRNYNSLVDYFKQDESNDPVSKYCHKHLTNPSYHVALEILNHILGDLADLCKLFQKRNLTPLDAIHLVYGKLNKIKQQYLGEKVSWDERTQSLLNIFHQENIEVDTRDVLEFVRLLCEHMEDRFPREEVQEWSLFDCLAIRNCDYDFGIEEVRSLCSKYASFLNVDNNVIVEQYNNFKYVIREKIKSNLIKNYAEMVKFALDNDEFCHLAKLMDIGGTFLASSVDCERGFSLMNSIKNERRNRLNEKHLDMIMRVKSYVNNEGSISLDSVYSEWVNCRDRREKQ